MELKAITFWIGNPFHLPAQGGATGITEDDEVDSYRGKDNWANGQKLCQRLIKREDERYRLRNPLIALSLKDAGGQIA